MKGLMKRLLVFLLVGVILIVNKTKGFTPCYGKATLRMLNSTGAPKFKTSNKKIATVDTAGVITAVKAGNCKVTATVGKHVYTCRVTVKNAYSTQSLKKNFTLSANTTNGIVKFKIVNKYNHPMYIEIIGKEVKADGSNTGVSTNYNVPAKSTIYRYYQLSASTSTFLFEKRTFSYSNNGGVGRCISPNKYMGYGYSTSDYLTFANKKLGFQVSSVETEPYEDWFSKGCKVYISGNFHNSTPVNLGSTLSADLYTYIVFYKGSKPVAFATIDRFDIPKEGSGSGTIQMDHAEVDKLQDWDGSYDTYKIVSDQKSLLRVQ